MDRSVRALHFRQPREFLGFLLLHRQRHGTVLSCVAERRRFARGAADRIPDTEEELLARADQHSKALCSGLFNGVVFRARDMA